MAIPWCHWFIRYETQQLVLSLPDEASDKNPGGLTGGFVETDPNL
jgi:hypothetical protein